MSGLPAGFPRTEEEEVRAMVVTDMAASELLFGQRVSDGAVMADGEYMGWSVCDPETAEMAELLLATGHLSECGVTTARLDGDREDHTVRLLTLTPAGWELKTAVWSGTARLSGRSR